jgi:L-histidine Nalpha-methyltransferase
VKTANVVIDSSQFPENVRRDLVESFRSRAINHKFHYDSVKQTQKWLALHRQFSPSRRDKDCRAVYEQSFRAVARRIESGEVHVIGLGCGGGEKDTGLLKLLKTRGRKIFYTPCDGSGAMVLTARRKALRVLPENDCFPFVCDLATAKDLAGALSLNRRLPMNPVATEVRGQKSEPTHAGCHGNETSRVITFFGMIPNFEPQEILPKLAGIVGRGDLLLFSANLAPGKDYANGMKKILRQYDNTPTRDWLMTLLLDSGIEKSDGRLLFEIEAMRNGLKRFAANFYLGRARTIKIENKTICFKAGEKIRLFFSYRYTAGRLRGILGRHKLEIVREWIAASGEEGVFLCRRK